MVIQPLHNGRKNHGFYTLYILDYLSTIYFAQMRKQTNLHRQMIQQNNTNM